jgi:release factor glutamine methyltransferase
MPGVIIMKTDFQKEISFNMIVKSLRDAGCVYAEEEARLLISESQSTTDLTVMIEKRVNGLPLEHIVGWADFLNIRIAVDPKVFIPRRRTEFLVLQAAELIEPDDVVVDLCCGTGAVGAVLAETQKQICLHAVDIDPIAVRCARRNISEFGVKVYEGNLFEPLPISLRNRVDILVANAPYVPTSSIRMLPSESRLHEAQIAVDGGIDGHDIQRKIAEEASHWLAPGGHLLVETSERQASETLEIFNRNGLLSRVVSSSELDATVVIGTKPATKG